MDELEIAALRTMQTHEMTALRRGHALATHLSNMQMAAWEKRADHNEVVMDDLGAQHAMEGEALHCQWQQRKSDLEFLKQIEMQAVMAKYQFAQKANQDSEAMDAESMAKRHVFEQDRLQRSFARDHDLRTTQAQMGREVLASEQCYADSSLRMKHDLQNEALLRKHTEVAAKFHLTIEPLPIKEATIEPMSSHRPDIELLSIDDFHQLRQLL